MKEDLKKEKQKKFSFARITIIVLIVLFVIADIILIGVFVSKKHQYDDLKNKNEEITTISEQVETQT